MNHPLQHVALPARRGPRPRVTPCAPHAQLDQFPAQSLTPVLLSQVRLMAGVSFGASLRAPVGTVGFFLEDEDPRGREQDFLLGNEFAHVHPDPDGSLHVLLPEPVRSMALQAGWAERHPLAGLPQVPEGIVLVYAPRDADELAVVMSLVQASWRHARRREPATS